MDSDDIAESIMDSEYPSGPLFVHVVDHDNEYWLEVTGVKMASLIEVPWQNGLILETKPIPQGVMARMPRLNPRPYFRTPTSNTPMPTPAERLHDLQAEGALDFIPQDPKDPRGGREMVYITPPESSGVVEIPVDPHYGRSPTIGDIATKSPEQLAQMYPNGLPSFTPHDLTGILTSETENLQPPKPEVRFEQYRDPFRDVGKSYARMELSQHGQLPETGWRYETAPEFAGAGTEHLAEELQLKQKAAEELIEKNPFPAEQQDQAEPHYAVASEINERQVYDAFGTDRLFANPHMGDPKE